MEFKKPDVKGPRYRPEAQNILTKKFFEDFKSKHSKYKHLENQDLRMIIKKFNESLFQNVIDIRDGMQLPESIGWLFIGTCQTSKKKNIDFANGKNELVLREMNKQDFEISLRKVKGSVIQSEL